MTNLNVIIAISLFCNLKPIIMKTLIVFLSMFFISCSSYQPIKNKDLQNLNERLSGEFNANAANSDPVNPAIKLQELFKIQNADAAISLKMNKNKELEIHFRKQNGVLGTAVFKGKFQKKYFKVFLEKKRIPFVPIYSITQVNKLKIGLDKKGRLIINNTINHSGMILMMAAGHSSDRQYVFNPSKN